MPGSYRIMEKDIDHKSSIYGDYEDFQGNVILQNIDNRKDPRPPGTRFEGAKMYYFMRVYGGVGMHQGYLPGYPASHGCIRLPGHMAEKFYREVHLGTPVEIVP
jgi:lipoprotein-anchoring transpeptidase ErfK/SrfK